MFCPTWLPVKTCHLGIFCRGACFASYNVKHHGRNLQNVLTFMLLNRQTCHRSSSGKTGSKATHQAWHLLIPPINTTNNYYNLTIGIVPELHNRTMWAVCVYIKLIRFSALVLLIAQIFSAFDQ